ncbi:hypothetical protein L1887_57463 [Cichorium endivia]|nr:hypothetical protein L1887_57463 [Cichorium endivia]
MVCLNEPATLIDFAFFTFASALLQLGASKSEKLKNLSKKSQSLQVRKVEKSKQEISESETQMLQLAYLTVEQSVEMLFSWFASNCFEASCVWVECLNSLAFCLNFGLPNIENDSTRRFSSE